MKMAEKVDLVIAYAVARPDGFTYDDIRRDFGWSRSDFGKVVNKVRLLLGSPADGSAQTINLLCDPQKPGEPWLYRMLGNGVTAIPWQDTRMNDAEARFQTMLNVARSVLARTDGRTREGQRAKIVVKAMTRLLEDLDEIRLGVPV